MSTRYEHVFEQVDDYLHDLLSPEAADYVEQHCERCPLCEVALREARKRLEAMQSLPPAEASEQLIARTFRSVEQAE